MFKKTRELLKDVFSRTKDIQITNASQPHVLAVRMRQANLTHNEMALVDIKSVRVIKGKLEEEEPSNTTTMFFCPVENVIVKQRLAPGDGQYISDRLKVELDNIEAPKPIFGKQSGLYDIKNVLVRANGVITIKATPKTKWVKV